MDAYGHVNNAVYLNYLEECRDAWAQKVLGSVTDPWDFVLVHVEIDFRSQLTQDDGTITVTCELEGYGTSSVRTREEILKSDGTLSAEARSVMVPVQAAGEGSRPLSDREKRTLDTELASEPAL
jgi:acyl-CoA thioester hydrolase